MFYSLIIESDIRTFNYFFAYSGWMPYNSLDFFNSFSNSYSSIFIAYFVFKTPIIKFEPKRHIIKKARTKKIKDIGWNTIIELYIEIVHPSLVPHLNI